MIFYKKGDEGKIKCQKQAFSVALNWNKIMTLANIVLGVSDSV
jgi:hypothetical protein